LDSRSNDAKIKEIADSRVLFDHQFHELMKQRAALSAAMVNELKETRGRAGVSMVTYPDVDEARTVVVTRTLPSYSHALHTIVIAKSCSRTDAMF
jgi:hypothetical protein